MRPTKDYNGCSVLRRYFAQLHLLRARFPPETLGQIPVDFAWKDAYSGAEYIQEGLQIEQASILYNIAALHAQLGSHGKRDTEQEMKEAVTHFQCAAGAFSYLDEHFAINHASKDLSTEFVSFYSSLMLGQAQECLVEKSLKGIGRVKNATISRLATRVSEFYGRCVALLEGSVCNVIAKKNRDWTKLLKFKVLYYQAIAHFYQGAHAEEMGKYGELIALTQLTVQRLNAITGKPPKGMGDLIKMARQNFAEHATEKLAVAKRQNEQVYHDSVPQIETLELMAGADLVKPVSFHPTDPKNLGTDIFSRLIPMRAHEVASIFSEEKAKLMRSVMSSVEEKDEELEQFMKSLNAREVEKIHDGPPTIPDNVLHVHQSLQGKVDEVRKLHASCLELMAMSRCVEEDIAAIADMKKKEETEEEQFQSQHGVRPVSQVCSGLWKEMESYHKYNSQASKSNSDLKAMFDQHYPNLVLLTSPLASLKASLPKMTLLDTPAENASESERWQHVLVRIYNVHV
jgi:tyrosine-protein phosphatase non-receptor type 23